MKRKAIILGGGGFRPNESPMCSWFGKVTCCAKHEGWPKQNGDPMYALAQINLTKLPFRPCGLEDIEFITVFIGPKIFPVNALNGKNWLIRTYENISMLVKLEQEETGSYINPFPMGYWVVDEDFPCWEDIEYICPEEIDDDYYDIFENINGFKLGGWPSLIQTEIYWSPWSAHETNPAYVFQIDTTEKGRWMWGDNGVGYFGRGTIDGKKDEWALAWQCY